EVVADDEGIQIVPADPQVIFVPRYDPQVVFVQAPAPVIVTPPAPVIVTPPAPAVVAPPPAVGAPAITSGPPIRTAVWLTNDFNWRRRYVRIGGGWRFRRGGVWISINNRPNVWRPRSQFRRWPGWDGRPQRWRPRPGRPPFRQPSRRPVIPGRPGGP